MSQETYTLPPYSRPEIPKKTPPPSSCKRIFRIEQIYPLLLVFSFLLLGTGKSYHWKKLSLELELRLLALFEVIPLSPCGKRNPLSQSTPLWQFSAFRNANLESGTAKKQVFEKLELQTGTGKAHFTIVGVSFGRKLVEVFRLVCGAKQQSQPETSDNLIWDLAFDLVI